MAHLRAPSELIARPVASFIVVPPAGAHGIPPRTLRPGIVPMSANECMNAGFRHGGGSE